MNEPESEDLEKRIELLEQAAENDYQQIEENQEAIGDLEPRVVDLEAKREQITEPQLEELFAKTEHLQQRVIDLEQENEFLRSKFDAIGLLDENSTATDRKLALRSLLVNAAEADHNGSGNGKVAWDYSDVIQSLAANGHGEIAPAQAYRAMEQAADGIEGFGYDESTSPTVIRCNFREVAAHDLVNIVNNESPLQGTQQPATSD